MARTELFSLKELVAAAEAGHYPLPEELLAAYSAYTRPPTLEVAQPAGLDIDGAGAELVATLTRGEQPDLAELARRVEQGDRNRASFELIRTIIQRGQEQAGDRVVSLAHDLPEKIITDFLRPALEAVLEETRSAANALEGYSLEPHALLTAPAKVRTAYLSLQPLAARRGAILRGRYLANRIGNREPQHDHQHVFGTLRRPMKLFPDWKHPQQIPQLPIPSDPVDALLWLVGPVGSAAEPWCPTIAEMDAAWWQQFGENAKRQHGWPTQPGGIHAFGG